MITQQGDPTSPHPIEAMGEKMSSDFILRRLFIERKLQGKIFVEGGETRKMEIKARNDCNCGVSFAHGTRYFRNILSPLNHYSTLSRGLWGGDNEFAFIEKATPGPARRKVQKFIETCSSHVGNFDDLRKLACSCMSSAPKLRVFQLRREKKLQFCGDPTADKKADSLKLIKSKHRKNARAEKSKINKPGRRGAGREERYASDAH